MGSRSVWTTPMVSALLSAWLGFSTAAAEAVHQASGIRLPASIEGRFIRQEPKESGKSCSVVYASKSGHDVLVHIYPAKHGAHGPSKLDGDEKSAASPAFTDELDRLLGLHGEGLKDATGVSRMRFQALAKNGPFGMKATVRGKVEGKMEYRELLLFERNGWFVSITTRYPAEDWLKTGQSYTDVAHFLGWPAALRFEEPIRPDGKNKTPDKKRRGGDQPISHLF